MAVLAPTRYTALRDEVFESLVSAIVAERIPAGTRLIEAEIARQLRVSKTPIREAMIRLGRMGLVVYRPRRGTFVAEIGADNVRDIFVLRHLIEGHVTAEAAKRVTDAELAELARIVDDMASAVQRADAHSTSDLDIAFHERIYELSESLIFLNVWSTIRDRVRLWHRIAGRITRQQLPTGLTSDRLHQEILDALRLRSPRRAEDAARTHIERGYRMLGLGSMDDGAPAGDSRATDVAPIAPDQ